MNAIAIAIPRRPGLPIQSSQLPAQPGLPSPKPGRRTPRNRRAGRPPALTLLPEPTSEPAPAPMPAPGPARGRGGALELVSAAAPKVATEPESEPGPEPTDEPVRGLDAYHQYLLNIRRLPLLSPEEETRLAGRARAGDAVAREHLIQGNLRLVVKFARDYEHMNLPLLDLIEEGNIGLMKAVDRFDPARGVKLSVYAAFWIKQAIRRALGNHSRTVRVPIHIHSRAMDLERIGRRLHQRLERAPTEPELARAAGLSRSQLAHLRRSMLPAVSLDAPIDEDSDASLGDWVADDGAASPFDRVAEADQRALLLECLGMLAPREAQVLTRRFGLGDEPEHTLENVAEMLDVSRERIRQIQKSALKKLGQLMRLSAASRARWSAGCRRAGAARGRGGRRPSTRSASAWTASTRDSRSLASPTLSADRSSAAGDAWSLVPAGRERQPRPTVAR